MTNYQLICGAEIHVELKTKSKMFCSCPNDPFHAPKPNIYTCPVCLGLPGALVSLPNQRAIECVILLGLALHSDIAEVSKFDRKHYFYPDLPKGYQISQYDQPLCKGGYVDTSFGRVNITRIHLEEDTAKLQHAEVDGKKVSLIDFNRSSVPLMEIVTEPDIHSAEQAKEFLKKIRDIVRAIGISDADMEKGTMRLEANISLSPDGKLPNYKVEVKNINSFRFYRLAIESEIKRQSELLDKGETPKQETRGYRADTSSTSSQRSKEDAADYRYFPEPDLPPLTITPEIVETLRAHLPVLPDQTIDELMKQGVSASAAKILTQNSEMLSFIEQVKKINEKYLVSAANAIVNKKIDHKHITPEQYVKSLESASITKITDLKTLTELAQNAMLAHPEAVKSYQAGKSGAIGALMGTIMKESKGQADAAVSSEILRKLLENS